MDVRMPDTDGIAATRAVIDEGLTAQNGQPIRVMEPPRGTCSSRYAPRVLNDTSPNLTNDYRRWYPHFTHTPDQQHQTA
jgi:hypothetical protein